MSLSSWVALGVLLAALVWGIAYVFVRVRALLRAVKSLGSALDGATRELTASLDRMTRATEKLAAGQPRLQQALDRLKVSLARLAVLRAAVQDAQDAVKRITAVFPAK